jgi:hypothetical protein
MRTILKITSGLLQRVRADLVRPHSFAAERVGFLSCRMAKLAPNGLLILVQDYQPVADSDYVDDSSVGAMMSSNAIREALQFAYRNEVGMFHVHMHNHRGRPRPSMTDLGETAKFVPDFWHVRPDMPHGAVILSMDEISGRYWFPGANRPSDIEEFVTVGPKLVFTRGSK